MQRWSVAVLALLLAIAATGSASDVQTVASRPRGKPLPSFEGATFEGQRLRASELLGQRLLLYFFRPGPDAAASAQATAAVADLQQKHNFQVVGVASGASSSAGRIFLHDHGLTFPVVNDAAGRIARRFGMGPQVAAAYLFVDAEGYVVDALPGGLKEEDAADRLETALRERLRLPRKDGARVLSPVLGEYPLAPDFSGGRLEGGEPFQLASTRGEPVVLIFFLHTCPHCHHALNFLKRFLVSLPEGGARPRLVGVSIAKANAGAVRDRLRADGLDFFPVVLDPDGRIASLYGVVGGVPDILVLDPEGRIRARSSGWRDDRDPPLLRMRVLRASGRPVPMLLHKTGYSGNEFCGVCHEREAATWEFTQHAAAFETLVRHGADRNGECVSCHVVGHGETGGYAVEAPQPPLEDVGCESCHGRGGPHLSPAFAEQGYPAVCVTCHDTKHSLGFEYATFLPKVSHAAHADLLGLPLDRKLAKLEELGRPRDAVLPVDARFVGSAACRDCHAAEYETWAASPHARAVGSLEMKGKAGDDDCLACHTTGFGKDGGFPAGGAAASHPDLVGVGCESCHGPGSAHVAEGARRTGTILSLGDKCDSCVILRICGSCHDDANDPGFEFEVLDKIERQRHGTIEPGGKPKQAPQVHLDTFPERADLARRAFRALDAAGAAGAAGGR